MLISSVPNPCWLLDYMWSYYTTQSTGAYHNWWEFLSTNKKGLRDDRYQVPGFQPLEGLPPAAMCGCARFSAWDLRWQVSDRLDAHCKSFSRLMHICAIMLTYGYSYIYNYMNVVYIFIYYHFSKIYLFIYSFIYYLFIHYTDIYIYTYTWINYNALTATSLEWWLGWYRSHGRSFFEVSPQWECGPLLAVSGAFVPGNGGIYTWIFPLRNGVCAPFRDKSMWLD